MRKKIIIGLTFICLFSIFTNIIQYKKNNELKQERKFYDGKVKSDLNDLIKTVDLYNSSSDYIQYFPTNSFFLLKYN